MSQRVRTALIFIIPIAVVVALVLFRHMASRTVLNDGFVNGNTGSNLYNNGLFCENGSTLFFSNPDDGFSLYAMDRSGTDLRKLSEDIASFINADDHYIYYTRNNASSDSQFSFLHVETNSLCRIKKEGGKVKILDHDPDLYASLVGNYVYFLHYGKSDATTLYRVKIDGSEDEQIDTDPIYPCASSDKYIYYNGITDRSIYRMDTQTNQRSLVLSCDSWNPVVQNNYAYYIVPTEGYSLVRTNLTDQTTEILTTDRVDCFLVSGDTVIYQKNDANDPALMRIHLSAKSREVIAEGTYHSLNAAFDRLYFMMYGDDATIYYTGLAYSNGVSEFHPGRE